MFHFPNHTHTKPMKIKELFFHIKREVIGDFFPQNYTCDLCGQETFNGQNICPQCQPKILLNDGNTCPRCGRKTTRPEICFECKAQAPLFDKAVSPLVYGEGTALLIAKYKHGAAYLKNYFAELLEEATTKLPPFDGIVYVPMSDKAEHKRGYNQSKLLACALAKKLNVPVYGKMLQKRKDTNEQKSLSKRERAQNLQGCFHVHERKLCAGKRLLLIDDVLTTGATANEVSRVLKGANAQKVYLLTIASVLYHPPIAQKKSDI
jgi:ComF family protein